MILREVRVNGKPLLKTVKGVSRWWVNLGSGAPATATPRVTFSENTGEPGVASGSHLPAHVGGSEWRLSIWVTDIDDRGRHAGEVQRLKNRQTVLQAFTFGQSFLLEVKHPNGVNLSQSALVVSSAAINEMGENLELVEVLIQLLEGSWRKGMPGTSRLDSDGLVRTAQGSSAPFRQTWRFPGPINQGVKVYQGDTLRVDWHGKVPAGQVLVVDGWDWWTTGNTVTEWWTPSEPGSPMNLDQHDYLWPDPAGRAHVRVLVDGTDKTSATETRGTPRWL